MGLRFKDKTPSKTSWDPRSEDGPSLGAENPDITGAFVDDGDCLHDSIVS